MNDDDETTPGETLGIWFDEIQEFTLEEPAPIPDDLESLKEVCF